MMARVRLTQRLVADLQSPEHGERLIMDADVKGLGVRLRASGHMSYVIRWCDPQGRTKKMTLGDLQAQRVQTPLVPFECLGGNSLTEGRRLWITVRRDRGYDAPRDATAGFLEHVIQEDFPQVAQERADARWLDGLFVNRPLERFLNEAVRIDPSPRVLRQSPGGPALKSAETTSKQLFFCVLVARPRTREQDECRVERNPARRFVEPSRTGIEAKV